MAYKRKTRDVFVIQGYYTSGYGWEDVVEEDSRKAGLEQLRAYRQNAPEYPYQMIVRREKIEECA